MDLFKRIQDLSAIFDDDGPSAVAPESRPMFNNGGMLVQPNNDGSRPGYKGSSYSGETIEPNIRFRSGKYETSYKGKSLGSFEKITDARNVINKAKESNPPEKTGYVKKGSRGYFLRRSLDKFIKNNNTNPSFEEVTKNITFKDDYDKRKYKKVLNTIITNDKKYSDFKINTADLLNKEQQKIVTDNFELPPGQKEWNFKNEKYGVNVNQNKNLAERIKRKLEGPQKYTIAADASKPSGWMMSAMNRLYKNEIKKGVKPNELTYQPIKKEGIIIGFKDNTAAGKGKTYYGLNKNTKEDATDWKTHGDYNRIDKFLKIAKGAQINDPSKLLQKILDEKGITKFMGKESVLTLNDVLSHERYFSKLSDIAPSKLIEKQIVLHHTKGVGGDLAKAAATRDIQLLTGAVNDNVKNLERIIRGTNKTPARKLNADEIAKLKNYGAKIVDFDGKVVGGGSLDPNKQYANIEKGALKYAQSKDFNVKTVASYLERLGCGKAAGGRVLFSKGTPEATLTKCAIKGQQKLNLGLTNGFSNKTEGDLAKKILQAGRGMGSMLALRNILGPAAVGFTVAAEAGLVGYDMLATGKSFKEAVGSSLFNYALGDKTQIDNKKLRYQGYADAGVDANQIGKISAYENAIDEMNNTFGEFNEENRLYNIAVNQKGKGRIPEQRFQKIKQQQAENFYTQADKNKALIQDLERTQTEDRLDKAIDPIVPALMSDADAKRKAMQMTKPSTVAFGNIMDTIFPKAGYREDREKAINYMPAVQEYYRGNQFAGGGIAGLSGGDPEGAMTTSMNPDSQGLRGLLKHGKKI